MKNPTCENGEIKSTKFRYITLFVSLFALILIFVFIITITLLSRTSVEKSDDKTSNLYRVLRYNPETKDFSSGFTYTSKSLKDENDFISYLDEKNNHILISDFGSNQYQCLGSCSCVDSRRSSLTIPKRSIMYLVAAVTSSVAITRAKQYFDSECKKKQEGLCAPHTIQSEVEECKEKKEEVIPKERTKEEDQALIKKMREEPVPDTFFCSGKCVPRDFRSEYDHRGVESKEFERIMDDLLKQINEFGCGDIELEGKLYLDEDEYYNTLYIEEYHIVAERFYMKKNLHEHCKEGSFQDITMFDKKTPFHMCEGHTHEHNPTVKCFEAA